MNVSKILVIALVALGEIRGAQSNPPSPRPTIAGDQQKPKASSEKKPRSGTHTDSPKTVPAVPSIESTINKNAEHDQPTNRNDDPPVNWWAIGIPLATAIGGLGCVYVYLAQLNLSKRSERAWLIVEVSPPYNRGHQFKRGVITAGVGFDWTIKNVGKTPAFITKVGARLHPIDSLSDLPAQPDIDVPGLVMPTDNFLGGLALGPDAPAA